MKTKDVMIKYHKLVPFPWTPRKIKKAGFDPTPLMLELGKELGRCEDADLPGIKELMETLKKLDVLT